MDRRIGKFSISRDEVFNNPGAVQVIMGRCIITRCEFIYHTDEFEYLAISSDFDEVKKGSYLGNYLPEYRANVEDGIVTWTKIDESSSPLEKA